jgi:hypothetical protein
MQNWGVVLCLLAAGCSDSQGLTIASGSRLRARWQVSGKTRRLVGWHDNQLGVDCDFFAYIHGRQHRCIPAVGTPSQFFGDAACTEPLYEAGSFQYLVRPQNDVCTVDPEFFTMGAAADPSGIFNRSNGACVAVQVSAQLFHAGPAVPSTTFAGATERPDDAGQLWLQADDGARMPWGGWRDSRAVEPTRTVDGKLRWAPWIVAYAGLASGFSDAACTMDAAGVTTDIAYCPVDAVLQFTQGSCGYSVSFSQVGPTLATVYRQAAGACSAASSLPGFRDYGVGAPIADAAFPEVGEVLEGDGLVKVHHATLDGHPILQTGVDIQFGSHGPPPIDTFIDAQSGMPCELLTAADGKTRCFPHPLSDDLLFADAACTQPVLPFTPGCDDLPKIRTYKGADGSYHGRPIMDTVVPTQLYEGMISGACMPAGLDPAATYYRLGDELPPERFGEITEQTD